MYVPTPRLIDVAYPVQPKEIPDSTFLREIRAGVTTFATMAYIIAVNVSGHFYRMGSTLTAQAIILSQTGGTCVCDLENRADCDTIDSYKACKEGEQTGILVRAALTLQLSDWIWSPRQPPSLVLPASSSASLPTYLWRSRKCLAHGKSRRSRR